ncbi:hypothetical protein VP01_4396g1 [Puccinia sorghi]|uniref:Uncharacterized protein n=1 Tax=Puccinia sorghi TaxID=27349 RepID=A0A0L6UPP1_9BASI|nr:hypothetical protein VP01_4396g1 [Puccinia sorghi]
MSTAGTCCDHIEFLDLNTKALITGFLDHSIEKFDFFVASWIQATPWLTRIFMEGDPVIRWFLLLINLTLAPSLLQATHIVADETPCSVHYPHSAYASSSQLRQEFFTEDSHLSQKCSLIQSMPLPPYYMEQILCKTP